MISKWKSENEYIFAIISYFLYFVGQKFPSVKPWEKCIIGQQLKTNNLPFPSINFTLLSILYTWLLLHLFSHHVHAHKHYILLRCPSKGNLIISQFSRGRGCLPPSFIPLQKKGDVYFPDFYTCGSWLLTTSWEIK